jgi:predicted dehydrogenase
MAVPIGVGLIGYGFAGKTFHAPVFAGIPGLRLAAVASSNPARVTADWPEVVVEASPEALIARPDVDLVVIATPNQTHFDLARRALATGKNVVVDKPFTVTVAEARELTALAAQTSRLLSVFHNRRWDADFLTLRQLIGAGHLGRVVLFESHFDRYRPVVQGRWREQAAPGSGLWHDLGPHLLDQAVQLFGLPDAIQGDLVAQRDRAVTDDYFHVQLRYGPMRALLHGSALVATQGPRFVVHGTSGSYVKYGMDTQEDALKAGGRPPAAGWGVDTRNGELTTWHDDFAETRAIPTTPGNYAAYYAAVRDAIRGQAPNPVAPEGALQVMMLLELAVQSAQERRELPVTPLAV